MALLPIIHDYGSETRQNYLLEPDFKLTKLAREHANTVGDRIHRECG